LKHDFLYKTLFELIPVLFFESFGNNIKRNKNKEQKLYKIIGVWAIKIHSLIRSK
jgi:hypothetical protein